MHICIYIYIYIHTCTYILIVSDGLTERCREEARGQAVSRRDSLEASGHGDRMVSITPLVMILIVLMIVLIILLVIILLIIVIVVIIIIVIEKTSTVMGTARGTPGPTSSMGESVPNAPT